MAQPKEIGQTKDSGFEIGVRKTVPVELAGVWDFLVSDRGIKIWLGDLTSGNLEMNRSYQTTQNIEGTVKVLKPLSHIRLTWKRLDWNHIATLQIRVIPAKNGTTVSFHQDHLLDGKQRNEMKIYWDEVLNEIIQRLLLQIKTY